MKPKITLNHRSQGTISTKISETSEIDMKICVLHALGIQIKWKSPSEDLFFACKFYLFSSKKKREENLCCRHSLRINHCRKKKLGDTCDVRFKWNDYTKLDFTCSYLVAFSFFKNFWAINLIILMLIFCVSCMWLLQAYFPVDKPTK